MTHYGEPWDYDTRVSTNIIHAKEASACLEQTAHLERKWLFPTGVAGRPMRSTTPGIIFEPMHLPPTQPSGTNRAVVVRPPVARIDQTPGWANWHTQCRLCQTWILLHNHCPCGKYEHDHGFSYFLTRHSSCQDEFTDGIRTCNACAELLRGKILMTITIPEIQPELEETLATIHDMSGQCMWEGRLADLPNSIAELKLLIQQKWVDNMDRENTTTSGAAIAADGHLYNKQQFEAYYHPNAVDAMWRMARLRATVIALIYKHRVLDEGNYEILRVSHAKGTAQVRHDRSGQYVHQIASFRDFIPAKFWPHEPILSTWRACSKEHHWVQILAGSPKAKLDGHAICGEATIAYGLCHSLASLNAFMLTPEARSKRHAATTIQPWHHLLPTMAWAQRLNDLQAGGCWQAGSSPMGGDFGNKPHRMLAVLWPMQWQVEPEDSYQEFLDCFPRATDSDTSSTDEQEIDDLNE